jgi:trehalose-6-phosphate synthase
MVDVWVGDVATSEDTFFVTSPRGSININCKRASDCQSDDDGVVIIGGKRDETRDLSHWGSGLVGETATVKVLWRQVEKKSQKKKGMKKEQKERKKRGKERRKKKGKDVDHCIVSCSCSCFFLLFFSSSSRRSLTFPW